MVFGSDIAVVLRSRRLFGPPKNLLLQTHGLNVKAVTQAALEVSAVLEGDLSPSGELIDAGLAGQSGALACGHLHVVNNRFQVLYRLVGQVLVVVVADLRGNVFSALNLVRALTQLLIMECKSIEVTPERLEKRYPQVYLGISALVTRGNLDVVGAILDSHQQLDAVSPDAVKQKKARERAAQQAASAAVAALRADQNKQINRRLPEPTTGHQRFKFAAPGELTSISVPLPYYHLPPLPEPDQPLRGPQPDAKLLTLEEAQAEAPKEEAPKEVAPQVSLRHEGPSLLLEETWLGEVQGSRVVQGGLQGLVRWATTEAKVLSGNTPFGLQLPPPPEDELVVKDQGTLIAALRAARASLKGTRPGPELGTFLADTLSPLPPSAPLLMYQLPAACSGVMPLLVQMAVGLGSRPPLSPAAAAAAAAAAADVKSKGKKDKGKQVAVTTSSSSSSKAEQPAEEAGVVLVTVSWAVATELDAAPTDLVAELVLPPAFGAPKRVAPTGAQWSSSQCLLRWRLGGMYLGCKGSFVAAFRVPGGVEAAVAGLSTVHALLVLKGQKGVTLTGVQVTQPATAGGPLQPIPETSHWSAVVLARPPGVALPPPAAAEAAAAAAAAVTPPLIAVKQHRAVDRQ